VGILDGKVAVITGAGSGMGKASANVFAREGARLVISDITGAEDQTASDIGGSDVVAMHCDVSKEEQVAALVQAAVEKFGRVDAVLSVGGIASGGPIDTIEEAEVDRIYSVNFKGVFFGTKYAIKAMKDTGGGSIVNWSSLAGVVPSPYSSIYSSMKAAVAHFTKSTAVEAGQYNIRANALCPGMIATEGMGALALQTDPTKATRNPLGRAGTAAEAGEIAAFLCSDGGAYLNGVIIPLDGGWGVKLA
jgi:NAD(P)-dependent dehydrogenase (short-subunit alcohol dehydrogenase family)